MCRGLRHVVLAKQYAVILLLLCMLPQRQKYVLVRLGSVKSGARSGPSLSSDLTIMGNWDRVVLQPQHRLQLCRS